MVDCRAMNGQTTSLAAVVGMLAPVAPLLALVGGAVALLALAESRRTAPAETSNPHPEPAPLPPAPGQPRLLSGKYASRVQLSDLRAVFANGPLSRAEAVAALCQQTGCSKSAAYGALAGRLAAFLTAGEDGRLAFTNSPRVPAWGP